MKKESDNKNIIQFIDVSNIKIIAILLTRIIAFYI